MAANSRTSQSHAATQAELEAIERPKEIVADLTEYLTDYARQNPGSAALWCIGVGFVLGWKLKPW